MNRVLPFTLGAPSLGNPDKVRSCPDSFGATSPLRALIDRTLPNVSVARASPQSTGASSSLFMARSLFFCPEGVYPNPSETAMFFAEGPGR